MIINRQTFKCDVKDCGGKLEVKEVHRYYGIPKYILGHNLPKEKESKLYRTWAEMISRCSNSKHRRYVDWGGRGIIICPEWANDFVIFRDWALTNGYKEGLEINRINNNGNYEPENCNFVTSQENSQNRRTTKLNKRKVIEIREKYKSGKYTTRQLAKEYNLKSKSTVIFIINKKTWNNI